MEINWQTRVVQARLLLRTRTLDLCRYLRCLFSMNSCLHTAAEGAVDAGVKNEPGTI
uniref:Uncharacterized protein n=1 Tax=Rhizophora mucronata TaxID=61149 RepID=A0A2P2II65_RHIMU